jgi:hypothetical protein
MDGFFADQVHDDPNEKTHPSARLRAGFKQRTLEWGTRRVAIYRK